MSTDTDARTPTDDVDGFVRLVEVCKTFHTLDSDVIAADHISLTIARGTATALTGPSGSGKSTLLHLIGALEAADSGTITVDGESITRLNRRQLPHYRRSIGIVFQRFNLLPSLTVLDNVMAPMLPQRATFDVEARARQLLKDVGLAGREHSLATRLSGGQQQRVAIARALINNPKLILADEPTGNLDSHVGADVAHLLFDLVKRDGATLVVATHDPDLATQCDRTIHVRDGRIIGFDACLAESATIRSEVTTHE